MKVLVIQTSFLGDVILATAVVEKLYQSHPTAEIDFLLRKGNESLLEGHTFIRRVIAWDKASNKLANLFKIASEARKEKYDVVVNLHRFASSGFVTWRSAAPKKLGFDKNPFSFCYTTKVKHEIGNGKHETERNQEVIASITDIQKALPRLYPRQADTDAVKEYKSERYICIAPSSVWFTKQLLAGKWVELCNRVGVKVYLLGSSTDVSLCNGIIERSTNKNISNLAGKLTLLQSAALMKDAVMNYVNDSAPLHLASAVNAPVTAVFCSTVPAFGFGPLSEKSFVVETNEKLDCRPCGLHGYKACPKGHFKCATTISVDELADVLKK